MAKSPISFIDSLVEKINTAPPSVREMLYCVPIGLLSGFLLKMFGRLIFLIACVVFIIMFVGNNFNIISLHIGPLLKTFGLESFSTISDVKNFVIQWLMQHPSGSFALFVSFLIGWKIG